MRLDDVDGAIAAYAVMLNRAAWLNPDRLEAQRAVWHRLAAAQPGDAVIHQVDIDRAIIDLLDIDPSVLPPMLIDRAAVTARARAARVATMVDNLDAPSVYLATALARVARSDGAVRAAIVNDVVAAMADDLGHADVPDDIVTKLLDDAAALLRNPPALAS